MITTDFVIQLCESAWMLWRFASVFGVGVTFALKGGQVSVPRSNLCAKIIRIIIIINY